MFCQEYRCSEERTLTSSHCCTHSCTRVSAHTCLPPALWLNARVLFNLSALDAFLPIKDIAPVLLPSLHFVNFLNHFFLFYWSFLSACKYTFFFSLTKQFPLLIPYFCPASCCSFFLLYNKISPNNYHYSSSPICLPPLPLDLSLYSLPPSYFADTANVKITNYTILSPPHLELAAYSTSWLL